MNGEFWPWWWGALVIGGIATAYPLISGRMLGVSSLYASFFEHRRPQRAPLSELEAALMAETEAEFGSDVMKNSSERAENKLARWRLGAEAVRPLFLVGMIVGPALLGIALGDFRWSLTLGKDFDGRYGTFGALPIAVLVVSGVLIGFGTRLAGGCTSGHGISGVARGQSGSLFTTAVFWATALGAAWVFYLFGVR